MGRAWPLAPSAPRTPLPAAPAGLPRPCPQGQPHRTSKWTRQDSSQGHIPFLPCHLTTVRGTRRSRHPLPCQPWDKLVSYKASVRLLVMGCFMFFSGERQSLPRVVR